MTDGHGEDCTCGVYPACIRGVCRGVSGGEQPQVGADCHGSATAGPTCPRSPWAAVPGAAAVRCHPAAGRPPSGPCATGTRSARSPTATRPRPTAPAPRTPTGPASAAPACAAEAAARGSPPRKVPSLVKSPGVEHGLRGPVSAQHHHQVAHHCCLSFFIQLNNIFF